MKKTVDVAILGGGLAGNLLARQLRREVPDASVAMFEKSTERRYKVGESTVEVATNYLTRRLGLSTYIYSEHLPKNGLRYFFDTPQKDSPLPEMSELGVHGLPPYPSFQLDRARLEADLIEMNAADGVDIHRPARVKDLVLGTGPTPHCFTVVEDGEETEWEARWVVDGTGRERMLHKMLDLTVPEKKHRVASAWGRLKNVQDWDDLPGAEEWHARARYTSRFLSTNHFMYEGYWIWFIPLRHGITSVGVVQDSSMWDVARHKPAGFMSYLREHGAIRSLLADAELIDLEAFTQLSFRTKRFYGERWATVGDSSAFPDPFYSPGSDFIAYGNDLIADLVRRELGGEDVGERTDAYDGLMKYRFDTTMVIYEGMYPLWGSYELFRAKVFFDTAAYYALVFDSYARDEHRDLKWVKRTLRRRHFAMEAMTNFNTLFRNATQAMKDKGTYHRNNQGHAELEGRKTFGVMEEVGIPRSRKEINDMTEAIFAKTQRMVAAALDEDPSFVEKMADRQLFDAWSQLQA